METREKNSVTCTFCEKTFINKSSLTRHCNNIHKLKISGFQRGCDLCSESFSTLSLLRDHHESRHGFNIEMRNLTFSSVEEFLCWKTKEETELNVMFVKNTAARKLTDGAKKWYFICNRSGNYKCKGKGQRQLKSQGSSKTGRHCLASMEVKQIITGEVSVKYFSSHYAHEFDIAHLLLSAEEKNYIAGKLRDGASLQFVLDHIRDGPLDDLSRIHLTTKKDLYNIQTSFNISYAEKMHHNDKISVECWIKAMQSHENNPVLLFKQQGEKSDKKFTLNEEDFMLVLMTQPQKELLQKLGTEKICIDSTHGTNGYDFQLTTLVVVDEFGSAFPCAYCISSKINADSMSVFFKAVKDKVGALSCKIFMSDDAPAYYNAWVSVMGEAEKKFLCIWHVDKNWRQNVNKLVPGKELKALIYSSVRTLLECTDKNKFNLLLASFLKEIISPETILFKNYFETYYAKRPEMWAYCYRLHAGLNTNMYLENLHRNIKHCYLEGKVNKRVDKLLSTLLKLTRDKLFERLIKLCKGKITYRIANIHKKHKESINIPESDITDIVENSCEVPMKWKVKSQTTKNMDYIVEKNEEGNLNACKECKLACDSCHACIHSYACSCIDHVVHFNMCKHIHAVIINGCLQSSQASKAAEADVDDTEYGIDKPNQLLQKIEDLKTTTNCVRDTNKTQERVTFMAESLVAHLKTKKLDEENLLKLQTSISKMLDLIEQSSSSENIGEKTATKDPHNKKVIKQPRFVSTKKQRTNNNDTKGLLRKPTILQKESIEESLVKPSEAVLNIHSGFDHIY